MRERFLRHDWGFGLAATVLLAAGLVAIAGVLIENEFSSERALIRLVVQAECEGDACARSPSVEEPWILYLAESQSGAIGNQALGLHLDLRVVEASADQVTLDLRVLGPNGTGFQAYTGVVSRTAGSSLVVRLPQGSPAAAEARVGAATLAPLPADEPAWQLTIVPTYVGLDASRDIQALRRQAGDPAME